MPEANDKSSYGDYEEEKGWRYAQDYPEARPAEQTWLARVADEEGGPVCELACGHGRLCFPIAHRGLAVVGMDRSRTLVELARDRAQREPRSVQERLRFVVGDLRSFDLGEQFRYVFIFFGGFFLLERQDDRASCLACVSEHLLPGGLLELEDPNPCSDSVSRQEMEQLLDGAGLILEAALQAHELPLRYAPPNEPALLYRARKL